MTPRRFGECQDSCRKKMLSRFATWVAVCLHGRYVGVASAHAALKCFLPLAPGASPATIPRGTRNPLTAAPLRLGGIQGGKGTFPPDPAERGHEVAVSEPPVFVGLRCTAPIGSQFLVPRDQRAGVRR